MCVFSKEWNYILLKKNKSESILELIVFGWKNEDGLIWMQKVMEGLWEVDPEKEFCAWSSLVEFGMNLTGK